MASFYNGKNVLIAGGAGMTGQSLLRKLLDQGAHVRATQYQSRKIEITHKNLEIVKCNLLDPEQANPLFKDMDIVFLCAAKVGAAKAIIEDPSGLLMYNLELHSKLMYQAVKAKVDRVAFLSSSYVYPHTGGPNVESEGFQGDPWKPLNYGLGWIKRYLETLSKHFHMTSNTHFAIVRPTAIYGPYDKYDLIEGHMIPANIVKAVNRQDPFEVWGTGDDIRSQTYVDDLIDGWMLTTEKYAVAEALNICHKDPSTVKGVIKIILEHLNFTPKVIYNSTKPSVIPYKVSDPSKAKELLKWEARTSLKEGLGKTIDWYVNHLKSQREEKVAAKSH